MNLRKLTLPLLMSIALIACDKDDDTSPNDDDPSNGRHTGVYLYDSDGVFMDCYGDCDDDWTDLMLTEDDIPYFNFPDDIMVFGQSATEVSDVKAFPNPVPNGGDMTISANLNGASYFRMVIINSWGNGTAGFGSPVAEGMAQIRLHSIIFDGLRTGERHRIYFAFYNASEEIIYSGRGDFVICEESVINDPFACID
ncbi:MAG: hypothetical protein R3275_02040 [Saprospiraceae bacterium]|nr:hypothetical protein [Saprospiraceae bacterium]